MVAVSFTLRRAPTAQGTQHAAAVHELAGLVFDLGGKIRLAALGLQVERRQQKGLDDRGRLKFLVSPALHGVALQVVHKNAHPA